MRKVVAAEFLSLDGVMESPDKWHFPYFDDDMGQAVGESFAAADAMLIDDPSDIGGKRQAPFEEGEEQTKLELVDSKTFSTGVLYLTYQPAQG
jgi:hypothetical protein